MHIIIYFTCIIWKGYMLVYKVHHQLENKIISEVTLSSSYGTAKKFQIIIVILQFSLMEVKSFYGAERKIFLSNNL